MDFQKQELLDQNIKDNGLTKYGVNRPYTIFVFIAVILILGVFAFSSMTMELFPNMNIPYIVVMAPADFDPTDPSGEMPTLEHTHRLTEEVTGNLSMVSGVRNISTTSSPFAMIIFIELSGDANMTRAVVDIREAMAGIHFGRDWGFLDPEIMTLDPNMMPVITFSVLRENVPSDIPYREFFGEIVIPAVSAASGVARVSSTIDPDAVEDIDFALYNNAVAFNFTVQQMSEAATTTTVTNVISALRGVQRDHPDFSWNVVFNQGEFIEESIGNVIDNLIIGGALAILILFIFLKNVKLTLAVAISIPLSVVGTFVFMHFMGITLNIVSMSGLALAVGMLLDNSIIVIENIFRLRRKGFSVRESAIKGASQIMGAILAATFTTVAVFIPMFFVSGLMMEIFMDMVWVIIFALVSSLIVAMMFLPSIISAFKICTNDGKAVDCREECSREEIAAQHFALNGGDGADGTSEVIAIQDEEIAEQPRKKNIFARAWAAFCRPFAFAFAKFGAGYNKVMKPVGVVADKWYNSALKFTIKWKWVVLPVVLALFVGSAFLAINVNGFELMPAQDTGEFSISLSLDRGNMGGGGMELPDDDVLSAGIPGFGAMSAFEQTKALNAARYDLLWLGFNTLGMPLPSDTQLIEGVVGIGNPSHPLYDFRNIVGIVAFDYMSEYEQERTLEQSRENAQRIAMSAAFNDMIMGERGQAYILASGRPTQGAAVVAGRGLYNVVHAELGGDLESISIQYRSGTGGGGMMGMLFGGGGTGISIDIALGTNHGHSSTTDASQRVYRAIRAYLVANNHMAAVYGDAGYFIRDVNVQTGGGMDMAATSEVTVTISHRDSERLADAVEFLANEVLTTDIQGVMRVRHNFGQDTIVMENRIQTATFTMQLEAGQTISVVQNRVDRAMDGVRDNAAMSGVQQIAGGFGEQFEDTFGQMLMAIVVGLLLMYLVMVALFRSFKSPFIVLITIPLAFTGAFLLLTIAGMPVSIVAMIGLLILMGVIVNNGIVLIDYINQAKEEGLSTQEALVAAANTRRRPVLMTCISTMLAMVPMAIGWGTGGELMQPVAIVTIGGLAYATLMTLLVVPAFYAIFHPEKKKPKLATVEAVGEEISVAEVIAQEPIAEVNEITNAKEASAPKPKVKRAPKATQVEAGE